MSGVRGGCVVVLAAGLLLACASPRRGAPLLGRAALPVQQHPGALVFARHCQICHPGGEGGLGPSLNDKPLPGFLLRAQVRQGFGVMPSFGEPSITPEELDQLVEYLLQLRRREPTG